jgi:hypothetical protein
MYSLSNGTGYFYAAEGLCSAVSHVIQANLYLDLMTAPPTLSSSFKGSLYAVSLSFFISLPFGKCGWSGGSKERDGTEGWRVSDGHHKDGISVLFIVSFLWTLCTTSTGPSRVCKSLSIINIQSVFS